ncbi:MAG: hypothetical protein ABI718_06795 [Acidobacteriota bacterium]
MNHASSNCTALLISILLAASLQASNTNGFGLDVLTDGGERQEFNHRGTVYIQALRGESYELRITNPTPYRVAVALSVDGLNTIDANHTDVWSASKWVLEPYGSAVISGWQINNAQARRFFFTGERGSYGAAIGQTANLGVIEAVYFRERQPIITYEPYREWPKEDRKSGARDQAQAPSPPSEHSSQTGKQAAPQSAGALSDEYAATGMGDRTDHEIQSVRIQLERQPLASVRLRYEYRDQLVKLGVIPSAEEPLRRRESAQGFEGFCPVPAEVRRN